MTPQAPEINYQSTFIGTPGQLNRAQSNMTRLLAVSQTCDHGYRQYHDNHTQRYRDGYMYPLHDQHFYTDEHQNHRKTIFEQFKAVTDISQQEVHSPQPQNSKQIGSQNDKWIDSNGKDGRNTVHGENHVGDFHQDQRQKQRSGKPDAVAVHEEFFAFQVISHRIQAFHPL